MGKAMEPALKITSEKTVVLDMHNVAKNTTQASPLPTYLYSHLRLCIRISHRAGIVADDDGW
jgi:hypothetical protein